MTSSGDVVAPRRLKAGQSSNTDLPISIELIEYAPPRSLSKKLRLGLARMVARTLIQCLPKRLWYPAVLRLVPLQAWIERTSGARRLDHMDEWMKLLTQFGGDFPIPWKATGVENLAPPGSTRNGVLYCSGHLPMMRLGLRALIELQHMPSAAIGHPVIYAPGTQSIPIWGSRERIPGIAVGSYSLLRARSILQKGGTVAMLTDEVTGGRHSRNAFRLARRLGTQIVFLFTEVEPDGSVLVSFRQPPFPVCTSEASIEANIVWLESELGRIVRRYS